MSDIKVTHFKFTYAGAFTADGFETEANALQARFHAVADPRFGRSAQIELPQRDEEGNITKQVVALSDSQLDAIKAVITDALSSVDFDPEFGPA